MRELKFRFWDPKDKAMIYDVTMFTEDSKRVGVLYAWDDRVVMQYTGLKDKNGKNIYEGDMVSVDVSKPEFGEQQFAVTFNEYFWDAGGLELSKQNIDIFNINVVGNIYEDKNGGIK